MADDKPADRIKIPHDVVNEQILVSAAVLDEELRDLLLPKISPDMFVEEQHIDLWAAMREMRQRQIEFSVSTLKQQVAGRVPPKYIDEIIASYSTPPVSVGHHVEALRWDSARAEVVRGPLSDLLRGLKDPTTAPERVKALARAVHMSLSSAMDRHRLKAPAAVARQHMATIEKRRGQPTYPFGIPGLDQDETGRHRMLPGLAPKYTTLITAVSGGGKSVLAAKIALEQARLKRRVLYGAFEMGEGPTIEMMAVMSLGWTRYKVLSGDLDDADMARLQEQMERIGQWVRFFDAPFHRGGAGKKNGDRVNDISLDIVHQIVADSGCEVVVYDLWERLLSDRRPEAERDALFRQQDIAKETGTSQILVCQQKIKEVEKRTDKRPARDTILGSGAYVDIGDTILGVHRPAQWKPILDDHLEVLVLKQRYGVWPIAIELDYNGDEMTMLNGREIEFNRAEDDDDFGDIGNSGGRKRGRQR